MTIQEIPVEKITPSPFQNRKTFDENKLNELSESIKQNGVIQPITVRLVAGQYQIVIGERRWRACHKAEVKTVPSIVRELSDEAAREIVLIENLQREDLELLEEAQGYADALTVRGEDGKPKYTVGSLAARIGKSENHVRQMLSLQDLPEEMKSALREGVVTFAVARLVARVPGGALREAASEDVLHPRHEVGPLNARQTAEMIQGSYMRTLKGVPFDTKSESLVPVVSDVAGVRCMGGACTDCPFRTGNNPAEFGEPAQSGKGRNAQRGTSPDLCTNIECFAEKMEAHWEEKKSEALKAGARVLSAEQSEKQFPSHLNGRLAHYSEFVELAAEVPIDKLAPNVKKVPSWKKLLEGADVKPEVVVARDPHGRPRELVTRAQAEAAIKMAAKKKNEACVLTSTRSSASDADRKERARKKLEQFVALETMTELASAIQKKGLVKGFWKMLLQFALMHTSHDGFWLITKRLGIDPVRVNGMADQAKTVRKAWETIESESEFAARIIEALAAGWLKFRGIEFDAFKQALDLYGVDSEAIKTKVRGEIAEGKKKKPKAVKVAKLAEEEPIAPLGKLIIAALKKKSSQSEAQLRGALNGRPVGEIAQWVKTHGAKHGVAFDKSSGKYLYSSTK